MSVEEAIEEERAKVEAKTPITQEVRPARCAVLCSVILCCSLEI